MSIYLDNAATSFPKPPETLDAMEAFQRNVGANPGRSGHRASVEAGRILYAARDSLARLFNIDDPLSIVFTMNATMALNTAILSLLKQGGHAITSSMEHNSVARPLKFLESGGVEVTYIDCDRETGSLDPESVKRALRSDTRLITLIHASNVSGGLLPVEDVGWIAREVGIPFLVDASQTAGAYPIDVDRMNIDLLAFPGHKSLLGPQGTGGLYVRPGIQIDPLMFGGTGSRSEYETQPDFMPDKLESGTPNTVGFAGLGAGVEHILRAGLGDMVERKDRLKKKFLNGLKESSGVKVAGGKGTAAGMPVVSVNIDGMASSEVGRILEEEHDILVRCGLHCAPLAHKTLGTFPDGSVRFSLGCFNTDDEIDTVLDAVRAIASGRSV